MKEKLIFFFLSFCVLNTARTQKLGDVYQVDIYSQKKIGKGSYVSCRTDPKKGWSIMNLDNEKIIAPYYYDFIFDFTIQDSILSVLAAHSQQDLQSNIGNQNNVLAMFRINLNSGVQLDSIPIIGLLYNYFDRENTVGIQSFVGGNIKNQYLNSEGVFANPFDATYFLYPNMLEGCQLARNPSTSKFALRFRSIGTTLENLETVSMQAENRLLVKDAATDYPFSLYDSYGTLLAGKKFEKIYDISPDNLQYTLAKNGNDYYLVDIKNLREVPIVLPPNYNIDRLKVFREKPKILFFHLWTTAPNGNLTFWVQYNVNDASVNIDAPLTYYDIEPLIFSKEDDIYYFLAQDKEGAEVKLFRSDRRAALATTRYKTLNDFDLISQYYSPLRCRSIIQNQAGLFDLVDFDFSKSGDDIFKVSTTSIKRYFTNDDFLHFKKEDYWAVTNRRPFTGAFIRTTDKINISRPFVSAPRKPGKLVAMARKEGMKDPVYISADGTLYETWKAFYQSR